MMLVYYLPALYRRVICFIDPLEMIKDTVERRTRLLWPGEEEEEDVTPQLISTTQYQTEKPSFLSNLQEIFFFQKPEQKDINNTGNCFSYIAGGSEALDMEN